MACVWFSLCTWFWFGMKQGEANGYFVVCGFCGILFSYASNNLSSLCSWADDVKFRYPWSSPPPMVLYTYNYDGKRPSPSFQDESDTVTRKLVLMVVMRRFLFRQGTTGTRTVSRACASWAPSTTIPPNSPPTRDLLPQNVMLLPSYSYVHAPILQSLGQFVVNGHECCFSAVQII
jgi:hypothetical protein